MATGCSPRPIWTRCAWRGRRCAGPTPGAKSGCWSWCSGRRGATWAARWSRPTATWPRCGRRWPRPKPRRSCWSTARGAPAEATGRRLQIKAAAARLGLTPDTLRNWERNGLIRVPRDPRSGYRLYGAAELGRLRVIRMLRQAGYSMMAILRMVRSLDEGRREGLREVLDTPHPEEDVYSVADRWLSTLAAQEERARAVIGQLEAMIAKRQ